MIKTLFYLFSARNPILKFETAIFFLQFKLRNTKTERERVKGKEGEAKSDTTNNHIQLLLLLFAFAEQTTV